jgi:hypothetical protein
VHTSFIVHLHLAKIKPGNSRGRALCRADADADAMWLARHEPKLDNASDKDMCIPGTLRIRDASPCQLRRAALYTSSMSIH